MDELYTYGVFVHDGRYQCIRLLQANRLNCAVNDVMVCNAP